MRIALFLAFAPLWFGLVLPVQGLVIIAKGLAGAPRQPSGRYERLAAQTDGQCASPKRIGGCRYDSETIRNTYHEESVTMFKHDVR